MHRESLDRVIRHVKADSGMGFITFSRLNEDNADDEIRAQISYFAHKGLPFEWEVFAYDKPSDLEERLVAHGFKPDLPPDDPGAVLVLDLQLVPPALLSIVTADVRQIVRHQLDDVIRVEERVWGENFERLKARLEAHLDIPGYLSVYAAYVHQDPACCGWTYFYPHSHFAILQGGTTLPEYRRRGLYKAVLCVRVQQALKRGYRFLTVDAAPMSHPILEKYGFQLLTHARSYKWSGVQEAASYQP